MQSTWTPYDFTHSLAQLLLMKYPDIESVRICLPREHVSPGLESQGDHTRALQKSSQSEAPLTLHAEFYGHRDENALTGGGVPTSTTLAWASSALAARYTLVAPRAQITARWCAETQRVLSVASLLHFCTLESHGAAKDEEDGGGRQQQHQPGLLRPLTSFHVEIFPYVPEMHWCREIDGVLGSHHWAVAKGTVRYHRHLQFNKEQLLRQHITARKVVPACVEDEHDNDDDCDSIDAAAYGVAGEDTCAGGTVDRKRSRAGRHLVSHSMITAPVRVACLLNVNAASSKVMPQQSYLIALHAPYAQLVTADASCSILAGCHSATALAPSHLQMFSFMKRFTTECVMPRVSLDPIGAAWHYVKQGAAPEAGSRMFEETGDDVCGIGVLGTSYSIYGVPHCYHRHEDGEALETSTLAQVRNIAVVIDIPPFVWHALYAETHNANHNHSRSVVGEAVASQVASCIQQSLSSLASSNVDVFSFRAVPPRDSTRGDGAAHFSSTPVSTKTSAFYSRDMMVSSIAESVSALISMSSNEAFVLEAERLLFNSSSTGGEVLPQCRRHTPAEIRYAITSKLLPQ